MTQITVRPIDLKGLWKAQGFDKEYRLPTEKLAIITDLGEVNSGGIIVTDDEAIHYVTSEREEFVVDVDAYAPFKEKVKADGTIVRSGSIFPEAVVRFSYDEITQFLGDPVPVEDFVRRFGIRIEANFSLLMATMRKKFGRTTKQTQQNRDNQRRSR